MFALRRENQMKLKKSLTTIALAAVMAFSLISIAGCGEKSDEDAIRDGITAELDAIKNMDREFIDLLAADSGSEEFSAYGIDVTEFMKKYLSGFDYSIDGIEVNEDGSSAVATVTLTCKSFAEFMVQVQNDSTEWAANMDEDTAASMSEDDINAAIGSILMGALDKVEAAPTTPISVTYEKVDGQWQATQGAEDAISAALLSN